MKRILRLMLAVVLMVNVGITPAFAADATGKSITLEKTIGTVTVENYVGREVTVSTGGRLYSGYTVTTGAGYAWINLDDTKIIKLDRYSQVTIMRVGTEFEVLVNSGEIFFNVTETLNDDETLDIRTSTMYMSIRGTVGTVKTFVAEIEDEKERITILTVYEGVVSTSMEDGDSNIKTELVYPAQQATATTSDLDVVDIYADETLADSPFALTELADDETLADRVTDATGTDLTDVIENSDTLLEEKEELLDNQEDENNSSIDTAIDELTDTEDTSSSSSSSSSVKYYDVTYYYNETLFGEINVKSGSYITAPILMPTEDGYWSEDVEPFDFENTQITGNKTLIWTNLIY